VGSVAEVAGRIDDALMSARRAGSGSPA
jgi:hypothetical protein